MKLTELSTLIDNAKQPGSRSAHQAQSRAAARRAYSGKTLLTACTQLETDTWQSGLNNNVLVLGCSGGGNTRHHVKPN